MEYYGRSSGCKCTTRIEFEVDGGGIYSKSIIEDNDCPSIGECLDCTEIDCTNLVNGIYEGVLHSEAWIDYTLDGNEGDGKSYIDGIVLKKRFED